MYVGTVAHFEEMLGRHAAPTLVGIKAGSLRGGDMIICLGAGDITKMAAGLAAAVAAA